MNNKKLKKILFINNKPLVVDVHFIADISPYHFICVKNNCLFCRNKVPFSFGKSYYFFVLNLEDDKTYNLKLSEFQYNEIILAVGSENLRGCTVEKTKKDLYQPFFHFIQNDKKFINQLPEKSLSVSDIIERNREVLEEEFLIKKFHINKKICYTSL